MKNKNIFKINTIYFIALVLVAIIFACGYFGLIQNDILSTILIQVVVMFAIPALLYTLLVTKNVKTTFEHTGFKRISINAIFISIALGIILYFLNSFIATFSQTIIALFGYERLSNPIDTVYNYKTLFKEFCLSAILPAVCEEFLHRGILLHASKKCGNIKYSLIFSSLFFGLTHLNINQFFYAAILGVLIGYISLVSNSIFPAIIIHFMNNFLSNYFYYGAKFNFPLATIYQNIQTFLFSNLILYVLASGLGVALLVYLYFKLVKRLTVEKVKVSMEEVIVDLGAQNPTLIEAQQAINNINDVLNSSESSKSYIAYSKGEKYGFIENIFLIASIFLGLTITILSFIWGII